MVSLSLILLLSFAALVHAKLYSATWDTLGSPVEKFDSELYLPGLPSDSSTTITITLKAHNHNDHISQAQCKVKGDKWLCDKFTIFPGRGFIFSFSNDDPDSQKTQYDSLVFAVETSKFDFGPVFMTNLKIKTNGGNMDWCNNVKYSGDAKHKTGEVKVKDNDCEVQYVSLG
ncbi:hypothetical protein Moror_14657 [Moniliophthora roreri MCA 2997]|uniref:Uncharacterized protein n=1 Tax=Moniliophthora roreri (strain MCA 2997) TaxID=1381753 RepID=V2XMJ9_MONRO|nr:hypothetical protein Moror_14657 [Moniliophthora roreri MCA 2997]